MSANPHDANDLPPKQDLDRPAKILTDSVDTTPTPETYHQRLPIQYSPWMEHDKERRDCAIPGLRRHAVRHRSTPGQPAGRPCLLLTEPQKAQTVIDAVRAGINLQVAASRSASATTPINGRITGTTTIRPMAHSPDSAAVLMLAEADAEDLALRGVLAAGEKDWKASAWWLSRRHSQTWAERSREGESGRAGVTINVGIALSPERSNVGEQPQAVDTQWVSVPALPDGDS